MKRQSKRRSKSLSLKIQYLQLELEEKEEEIRQYEMEFLEALSSVHMEDMEISQPNQDLPKINIVNLSDSRSSQEIMEPTAPIEGPEEMRQLWRSIAMLTHPDKTQGDEEKAELYKHANDAWRVGNYGELYKVAVTLGIDVTDSEAAHATLEEIAVEIEKKISEKEKSVLWEWGRAKGEAKQRILDLYLASKGKKRKC